MQIVELRLHDSAHLDHIAGGNNVQHRCNVEKDIVQVWEAPVIGRVLRRREAGRGRAQVTSFTLALVRLEAPRAEEAAAGGADYFLWVTFPKWESHSGDGSTGPPLKQP